MKESACWTNSSVLPTSPLHPSSRSGKDKGYSTGQAEQGRRTVHCVPVSEVEGLRRGCSPDADDPSRIGCGLPLPGVKA